MKAAKENPEATKGVIKGTFYTVMAALGIVATVGEAHAEHEEEKRQREQERKEQQKQQRREHMQSQTDETLSEAKSTALGSKNIDVLWEMNCPSCGMTWATTQDKKMIRSDDFNTHNFRIINEREWEYIQDKVEIQCTAPSCNYTKSFSKDSLWSP